MNRRKWLSSLLALPFVPSMLRAATEDAEDIAAAKAALAEPLRFRVFTFTTSDTAVFENGWEMRGIGSWTISKRNV